MPETPKSFTEFPALSLQEVVHRLRLWMAMGNVPGSDDVRLEIHFPSAHAQATAEAKLRQEISRWIVPGGIGPADLSCFEMEGLQVIFSNPEYRRAI